MIKKVAKITATASYSFAKLSPFANGITLTTVVAMYTGIPWIFALLILVTVFGIMMSFFHFSGLFKAEQEYLIKDLGLGEKK